MNAMAHAGLVDDRSWASKPGNLSVELLWYVKHFPLWPTIFTVGLVAASAGAILSPLSWAGAGLCLALNILFLLRAKVRFRYGLVNPAIVVGESPLTLAVYTNLSTGDGDYPVIKILRHPRPHGNIPVALGSKFATVAVYSGSTKAEHWENFDPVLVECATRDRLLIERTFYSIPDEKWGQFKQGLKDLHQPLKPGIYPVKRVQPAQKPPELAVCETAAT